MRSLALAALFLLLAVPAAQAQMATIDPEAFLPNSDLTHAYAGVTLNVDKPGDPSAFTTNSHDVSGPGLFQVRYDSGSGLDDRWTDDPAVPQVLVVEFDVPTDLVTVLMRDGCLSCWDYLSDGVVEAYDADGGLVTSTTEALASPFTFQTLSVSSGSANIASLRIYGTAGAGDPQIRSASISNIEYRDSPVATEATSWGGMKSSTP